MASNEIRLALFTAYNSFLFASSLYTIYARVYHYVRQNTTKHLDVKQTKPVFIILYTACFTFVPFCAC